MLNKKRNRNKNNDEKKDEKINDNINNEDKVLTPENKQLINIYKQRKKHIKQLQQISQGLQEQKELLKPSKKKKIKDGLYKYFIERKK